MKEVKIPKDDTAERAHALAISLVESLFTDYGGIGWSRKDAICGIEAALRPAFVEVRNSVLNVMAQHLKELADASESEVTRLRSALRKAEGP